MTPDSFIPHLAKKMCLTQSEVMGLIRLAHFLKGFPADDLLWDGLNALQAKRCQAKMVLAHQAPDEIQRAVLFGAAEECRTMVAQLQDVHKELKSEERAYLNLLKDRAAKLDAAEQKQTEDGKDDGY